MNYLEIRGAREHNLKNISLKIPRDKLTVITGLSGSGKSSLAFDTIYAEGQRRYVESLTSYARQFLGQMDKPDVDAIEGLSPAISIDQKTTGRNPRSIQSIQLGNYLYRPLPHQPESYDIPRRYQSRSRACMVRTLFKNRHVYGYSGIRYADYRRRYRQEEPGQNAYRSFR